MRSYLLIGLWLALCAVCYAGPVVAVRPKAKSVKIWDDKFVVVQELAEPKQIRTVQDAFRRAKRIRNNATEQVRATHKLDFAERWLIDLDSGEIAVVSKAIVDVYELDAKDLAAVRALIDPKVEPRNAADSRWNPAVWIVQGREPLIATVSRHCTYREKAHPHPVGSCCGMHSVGGMFR